MQPISPPPANCASALAHADSYRQQYLLPRPQMCSLTDGGGKKGDDGPPSSNHNPLGSHHPNIAGFPVSSLGGAIPSSGPMFHEIV